MKKCQCLRWLVEVLSAVYNWAVGGGSSLSAAGGGAGLLQAHRFAQPAGKIHFFHLRSFDERVVLKEKQSGAVSCTRLLLAADRCFTSARWLQSEQ